MPDNNQDSIYVRRPDTGETWSVKDQNELNQALQHGLTVVDDAKENEGLRLRERGWQLQEEEGVAGSIRAFGEGAARSVYDIAAAAPRLLGADVESAGSFMSGLGGGDEYDMRARAEGSGLASALGGAAPDVLALALSGGGSAALKGLSAGGKVAAGLAAETAYGGLAGSQVADELAWRETGEVADDSDRSSSALIGGALGGGLGVLGKAGASAVKKLSKGAQGAATGGTSALGGMLGERGSLQRTFGAAVIGSLPTGQRAARGSGPGFMNQLRNVVQQQVKGAKNPLGLNTMKRVGKQLDEVADAAIDEEGILRREAAAATRKEQEFARGMQKADDRLAKSEAKRIDEIDAYPERVDNIVAKRREQKEIFNKEIRSLDAEYKAAIKKAESSSNTVALKIQDAKKNLEDVSRPDFSPLNVTQQAKITKQEKLVEKLRTLRDQEEKGTAEFTKAARKLKEANTKAKELKAASVEAKQKAVKKAKDDLRKLEDKETAAALDRIQAADDTYFSRRAKIEADRNKSAKSYGKEMAETRKAHFDKINKIEGESVIASGEFDASKALRDAANKEARKLSGEADALAQTFGETQLAKSDMELGLEAMGTAAGDAIGFGGRIGQELVHAAFRPQVHAMALMGGERGKRFVAAQGDALRAVAFGGDYKAIEERPIAFGAYASANSDSKGSYVANMEMIRKIASDPTLMVDFVNESVNPDLMMVQPEIYNKQVEAVTNAIRVMSQYGKPFVPDPLTGKPEYGVSTAEAVEYKDVWTTAFSPEKFVNDFGKGSLSQENWEVAQQVYPELTQSFQMQVMETLPMMQSQSLSPTQRSQISLVTGTRDTITTGMFQSTYAGAIEKANSEESGPPPMRGAPPSPQETQASFGTLSQQQMTGG